MSSRTRPKTPEDDPKWSAPTGFVPVGAVVCCPNNEDLSSGTRAFGKRTCKPNSVPGSLTKSVSRPYCGHSSRRRVAADTHQRPTRRFRRLPEPPCRIGPMRSASLALGRALPSLFGLAPCGVYPASGITAGAVRSYRTFSPLPRRDRPRRRTCVAFPEALQPESRGVAEAVCFLWH